MQAKNLMQVLWPAFLMACVLEILVFGLVDPIEIGALAKHPEMSRQAVYAMGFAVFWVITTASSALSVWLVRGDSDS